MFASLGLTYWKWHHFFKNRTGKIYFPDFSFKRIYYSFIPHSLFLPCPAWLSQDSFPLGKSLFFPPPQAAAPSGLGITSLLHRGLPWPHRLPPHCHPLSADAPISVRCRCLAVYLFNIFNLFGAPGPDGSCARFCVPSSSFRSGHFLKSSSKYLMNEWIKSSLLWVWTLPVLLILFGRTFLNHSSQAGNIALAIHHPVIRPIVKEVQKMPEDGLQVPFPLIKSASLKCQNLKHSQGRRASG